MLLLTECLWPGPWTLLRLGTEVLLAFKRHDHSHFKKAALLFVQHSSLKYKREGKVQI